MPRPPQARCSLPSRQDTGTA